MRVETVTSAQNPKFKDLLALQEKSRLRRERGLFAVEGQRELGHCLNGGFIPQTLFVCGEVIARERRLCPEADASTGLKATGRESAADVPAARAAGVEGKDGLEALIARAEALNPKLLLVQLPAFLYEKAAFRGSTEGVIGVMRSRELSLSDLTVNPSPLIAVLEGVEKPGNLGAILLSADLLQCRCRA